MYQKWLITCTKVINKTMIKVKYTSSSNEIAVNCYKMYILLLNYLTQYLFIVKLLKYKPFKNYLG